MIRRGDPCARPFKQGDHKEGRSQGSPLRIIGLDLVATESYNCFAKLSGLLMAENSGYSTVKKILLIQFAVIVSLSAGFYILTSANMAISSIMGGLTAFLPNLYFAYRMSLVKKKTAKEIVRSFYSGESRKILMTFALFALAFQLPDVQFFPLMFCFISVLSVFWLALILFAQDFEIKL
jgi:ATP synthase protein I